MAGVLTSPGRNPLGDAFEFFADLKRVVRSGSQFDSDPTDPPSKNTNSGEYQVRCTATDLALSEHIGEMTLETESLDKFTYERDTARGRSEYCDEEEPYTQCLVWPYTNDQFDFTEFD